MSVGELLPNTSYDCCVSANYARPSRTEISCASIRSEDLLTPTDTCIMMISDTNMITTVVSAVLGCIIVILLAVCGGGLFHLLRSRTSKSGVAPKRYMQALSSVLFIYE